MNEFIALPADRAARMGPLRCANNIGRLFEFRRKSNIAPHQTQTQQRQGRSRDHMPCMRACMQQQSISSVASGRSMWSTSSDLLLDACKNHAPEKNRDFVLS